MERTEFESLPLHDALVRSVEIDWERKLCRFHLFAFVQPGATAVPYILEFSDVTSLRMPHEEPWGPSASVNSASRVRGKFQVEMQSGDVIEIVATAFTFDAL